MTDHLRALIDKYEAGELTEYDLWRAKVLVQNTRRAWERVEVAIDYAPVKTSSNSVRKLRSALADLEALNSEKT